MKKKAIQNGCVLLLFVMLQSCNSSSELSINWDKNKLLIQGDHLPDGSVEVWYLEAFCRGGSHERVWSETLIGHQTKLVSASPDRKKILLESHLDDGVIAKHTITVDNDEIAFDVTITNPTNKRSEADWAQPCIRVDKFTGLGQEDYINKSFLFVNNKLTMIAEMPEWNTEARYTPGQVWRPANVNPDDVNPRPLNPIIPDNGLIGCFSKNDKLVLATAWESWQELFQGIIVCLHSDFRIGGLDPQETKNMKGKIYIMINNIDELVKRYQYDFPD